MSQKKKVNNKKKEQDLELLVGLAKQICKNAYAPYSNFHVGAALLGKNGKIYTGVNVENASYGLTICAERSSLTKAVSESCKKFIAIAIFEKKRGLILPCGACRQVLMEFSPSLKIVVKNQNRYELLSLEELLPKAFSL